MAGLQPRLPLGYTPISNLDDHVNQIVNVIGNVVDVKPVRSTMTGDPFISFRITDVINPSGHDLNIRIFKRTPDQLPHSICVGDVVLIRQIQLTTFNNKPECVSKANQFHHQIVVFPAQGIPIPDLADPVLGGGQIPHNRYPDRSQTPTREEQLYAIHLRHSPAGADLVASQPADPPKQPDFSTNIHPRSRQRFRLIEKLKENEFCEVAGEVVKVFATRDGPVELYITDYTEHPFLFDHSPPGDDSHRAAQFDQNADRFGLLSKTDHESKQWRGPVGKLTLQVTLKSPHADYAVHVKIREGDFVYISNLRPKLSPYNYLEGTVWRDMKLPEKLDIRRMHPSQGEDAQLIRNIKTRKKAYRTKMGLDNIFERDANDTKRKAAMPLKKETKREKKAKHKKEAKEAAKAKEAISLAKTSEVSVTDSKESNKKIRCAHPNSRLWTLGDIDENPNRHYTTPNGVNFELPFICARYRSRVRVVDFKPDNLEDFARPVGDGSDDNFETESMSEWDGTQQKKWEWAFCLLVEDAVGGLAQKTRMRIIVAADGAEHLLRMEAADLKKDKNVLKELKEKLDHLWGNLGELKTVGVPLPLAAADAKKLRNNDPFECCIQEYGYYDPDLHGEMDNSQRLFRMVGTTIIA